MKYAVYTEVNRWNDEVAQKIMVMGVEANSLAGAEHKILDNFRLDNALAFDVTQSTKTFADYLYFAEAMSYEEFSVRAKKRDARIYEAINKKISEINEDETELSKLERMVEEYKERINESKIELKEFAYFHKVECCYTPDEKVKELKNAEIKEEK